MMRWFSLLTFALLIFFIPLISLNTQPFTPPEIPAQTQPAPPITNNQETFPANPPTAEPAPTPAPAPVDTLPLGADGFTLYDSGEKRQLSLSTRDFVRGALAAELPPTFHPEALKAQAVAAHTYALHLRALNQNGQGNPDWQGADLTADPQNWKGYVTEALFFERYGSLADAYWKTLCDAADAVCDQALAYEGEPILAAYHAMSSGVTEDAANVWASGLPYLVPVPSEGDPLAPDYETIVQLSSEQLGELLRAAAPGIVLSDDPAGWISVESRSPGGYVTALRVGDLMMHGKQLRELLKLRSASFTVGWDGAGFRFVVHGYGHGVGLSQYGADYLARQGMRYDEILAHYYPGSRLVGLDLAE